MVPLYPDSTSTKTQINELLLCSLHGILYRCGLQYDSEVSR